MLSLRQEPRVRRRASEVRSLDNRNAEAVERIHASIRRVEWDALKLYPLGAITVGLAIFAGAELGKHLTVLLNIPPL